MNTCIRIKDKCIIDTRTVDTGIVDTCIVDPCILQGISKRMAKVRHPKKFAPQMCFQALVGCFNPTTDSETLGKDPNWVFQFVKDKIIVVNRDENVQTAKFSP